MPDTPPRNNGSVNISPQERRTRALDGGRALGIPEAVLTRWNPRVEAAVRSAETDVDEGGRLVIDGLIGDPIDEEFSYWGDIFTGPRAVRDWLTGLDGGDGTVEVNSPGGSYFGGVDMTRLFSEHPGAITMVVSGMAASAASLLLVSADDVAMFRGSMVMIHEPWTMAVGNAKELRKSADLLDQLARDAVGLYRRRMGDDRDIMALLEAETWFGIEEAMEVGLVDRELEPREPDDSGEGSQAMSAGLVSAAARMAVAGARRRRGR